MIRLRRRGKAKSPIGYQLVEDTPSNKHTRLEKFFRLSRRPFSKFSCVQGGCGELSYGTVTPLPRPDEVNKDELQRNPN